jgi:hypothetical protein
VRKRREPEEEDAPRGLAGTSLHPELERRLFNRQITHRFGIKVRIHEPKFHLDPDEWHTGFLDYFYYEPDPALRSWLREQVPQALLRDVHRPVMSGRTIQMEIHVLYDPAGSQAYAEWREQLKPQHTEWPTSSREVLRAERAKRHAVIRKERWKAHLPDDAPRSFGRSLNYSED